jgi:uncharacterized membrane protein YeaQ/YmgE (transglycosylase-associated protein family)
MPSPTAGRCPRVGIVLYLIVLFVIGLVVGALARLLLPGPDPMSIGMTALVGICGTLSAGLFSWYVLHRHGAGLLLSLVFSMLIVWLYRRSGSSGGRFGGRRRF